MLPPRTTALAPPKRSLLVMGDRMRGEFTLNGRARGRAIRAPGIAAPPRALARPQRGDVKGLPRSSVQARLCWHWKIASADGPTQ